MKKTCLSAALSMALFGCGGGGSLSGEPSAPEVSPVVGCAISQSLSIASAVDDGSSQAGHGPEMAIDGNLDSDSRWSSEGEGKTLTVTLSEASSLTGIDLYWFNNTERTSYFDVDVSTDNDSWQTVVSGGESTEATGTAKSIDLSEEALEDIQYIRVTGNANSESDWNSLIEIKANGCNDGTEEGVVPVDDLNPNLPPSDNFILEDWYLSVPSDVEGEGAVSIKEDELNAGYTSKYFYTADDGGMVFMTPITDSTTSGSSYSRTELREMLRRGNTKISTQGVNKNNWVFSSAPDSAQDAAGGVDGILEATLAVNYVTTTGDSDQKGRVIVGQIHANDDEPVRIYYRKLPGNTNGSIYFAHEPINGSEGWYDLIGSRSDSASNPEDGIPLNEKFSYQIKVVGNILTVTIIREGKDNVSKSIDMSNSGFDDPEQYMYFKAGVYNQNKSGSSSDYVQATFYSLSNSHTGYSYNDE